MARKMKTMDGNNAAAWASYAFTDVAAIYPITPSSVMAEVTDEWAVDNRKNIFGQPVKVVEMQSEAGAAGAVHGSLAAGALTTTYTASQGLLLMIPNMYKMAGELLPSVIHVSARCVASHALNIFGDHSDVMACRQTGYAMLCSNNPQEVMDLGAIAHLSTIKGKVPFLHFFDGFRTSHEIDKIEVWDYDDLKEMVDMDAVKEFRNNALNPEHPVLRGSAQNPDIFFQNREACNKYYNEIPAVVEEYMNKVNAKIGTNYGLVNYYGAPDAEKVIVAMGSICDTIEETIDYLTTKGEKVGLIKIRLYRPFPVEAFLKAVPATCKKIAVLDRTKEPGSIGEPLYLDVCACYAGNANAPQIVGGRYGLGSKDTIPADVIATYKNLDAKEPVKGFTLAIEDDVTNLSLPRVENPETSAEGNTACKFWGLGSDGTVGANKNSIKIIGDHTDLYAQAYFAYDSKKSGGITVSHLRFGKKPIKSTYLINKANFVACHNPSYVDKYDMVEDLVPGGKFLLNCAWDTKELSERLPAKMKRYIAQNNISLYTIDAIGIAKEIGLGNKTSIVLQSAFFKIADVIPFDKAVIYMKDAVVKSFGAKGEKIVNMNHEAISKGEANITKIDVPKDWADAKDEEAKVMDVPAYVKNILGPCNAQKGDTIPVSTFMNMVDGHLPQGMAAFEKRGIAVDVPEWIPENCIQCNQCALVCPHAAIRPVVMNAEEVKNAPANMKHKKMIGKDMGEYEFGIAVTVMDCSGCGNCAKVCPAKEKALVMKPIDSQLDQQACFNYGVKIAPKADVLAQPLNVKNSQFRQPLLEFSGACAGCGETPYAKLITQICGDRAYISNATGCSSIWGGSAPSTPYTVNHEGHGPAWANSLFEDNAEHGLGMAVAAKQLRTRLKEQIEALDCDEVKDARAKWLETYEDGDANAVATKELVDALVACGCDEAKEILDYKEFLAKKAVWIFGGDGWAYDIGFGGLDHVIASGEDVNIMVFDTEVYSNTGGQASKSTPTGAVAQFAAGGKPIKKKNLAEIAMSYGYVYVAQVALGYDMAQTVKAIKEAVAYNGPSIIIGYAPCINHGIKGGMTDTQKIIKNAVMAGYWHTFRFDPALSAQGKNPFQMDSKAPDASYRDFIMNEVRYSSLARKFPDKAEMLFEEAEKQAKEKYDHWTKYGKLFEE
ncbi:MAG: pyruvate:ferredoxin (flavodoxin) oxidoreductase [Clostridia bacterium]|nr:pyruvate:ferredoxin (flavodoxin) oxidoreductase [Clostridia bacterium]